ncbi:MAG: lysophospholipid acyltransferase family protein [Candidatus Latescibacteria bacterium]|nr:lysophospholipid acyltransferase family protein [Candidatus Latescibacterota bacterium]
MKKKSISRDISHRIEYMILLFCGVVIRAMPVAFTYFLIKILGIIAFRILRIRRDVTIENLRIFAGSDVEEKELNKIACQAYKHIGTTFIEILLIPKFARNILDIVDMSEMETAQKVYQEGRGIIFVSGHFGSWELNGGSLAASGFPVTTVARSQSNTYVDELINRYRELFGMKVVRTGAPLKYLIRALRNGETIGLISDQDSGKKGVFVDFFGRKASTPQGAAQLALKYKAPVFVIMTIRTGTGRYKTLFREVPVYPDDSVETLTQRYTKEMENIIHAYPEQYFWMHRRWKTEI